MEYKVMINEFEGPLDLLLHLIKEEDIKIEDISLEKITEQYMNYIKVMSNLDLNIASEYLIMAAELIEIKAKMLIPSEAKCDEESLFEEDPKAELIKRLTEYKKYKDIVASLKELEADRSEMFTKMASDLTEFSNPDVTQSGEIELSDLVNAFEEFLKRKKADAPLNTKITKKEISLKKRSLEIMEKLSLRKEMNFTELFEEITKEYVVISFLAILSLAKENKIYLTQEYNYNQIIIKARG